MLGPFVYSDLLRAYYTSVRKAAGAHFTCKGSSAQRVGIDPRPVGTKVRGAVLVTSMVSPPRHPALGPADLGA